MALAKRHGTLPLDPSKIPATAHTGIFIRAQGWMSSLPGERRDAALNDNSKESHS
jgi:hypothetical protein